MFSILSLIELIQPQLVLKISLIRFLRNYIKFASIEIDTLAFLKIYKCKIILIIYRNYIHNHNILEYLELEIIKQPTKATKPIVLVGRDIVFSH